MHHHIKGLENIFGIGIGKIITVGTISGPVIPL